MRPGGKGTNPSPKRVTDMMLTRRRFLYTGAAATLAAAVGPAVWTLLGSTRDDGLPEIAYGRDRCDTCGMIISDATFAAASREGGATFRYDDIGCLLARSGPALAAGRASAFVHDSRTGAWIAVASAVYVRSPRIRSPMGYGLAAYSDLTAAKAAHRGTPVLTLNALLETARKERS